MFNGIGIGLFLGGGSIGGGSLFPAIPLSGSSVVALFGDSLEAHNDYASNTAGSEETSPWSRGYLNWGRMLDPRGYVEQWYDDTQVNKYSNGTNKGVSGNTTANMYNRLADVQALTGVQVIGIGGGTNDLNEGDPLTGTGPLGSNGSGIERNLRGIYDAFLARGVRIVILTPPSRPTSGTNSWASGSQARNDWMTLSAWMQAQADADPLHIQIVRRDLITSHADTDRTPITAYFESDNVHLNPVGGYHVAADSGGWMDALAAWVSPFTGQPAGVTASDLSPNPLMTGTGGTNGSNSSGVVATSLQLSTNNAAVTVVGSKDTQNSRTCQKLVITRSGSGGVGTVTLGKSGGISTGLPAVGTWVKPWLLVKTLSSDAFQQVAVQARQQPSSPANMNDYSMRTDNIDWANVALQTTGGDFVWQGGCAQQIRTGMTSIIYGVPVIVDNTSAGTDTVWIAELHLLPITDPRIALGFNIAATQATWGDGTLVTWGDGTLTTWSG